MLHVRGGASALLEDRAHHARQTELRASNAKQARSVQKHKMHDKLLEQEGYYHTHPEEKLLKGM